MATSSSLSMFNRSRKAAADYESNYGGLIILMVLSSAIIAYVILTTPAEREALGIVPEKYARTLLDVSPGLVTKSEVSESKSAELDLGSITVDYSAQKSAEPLRAQLSIKRSSYKDASATVPFSAKPELESAVLEAIVSDKVGDGNLIMALNGQEIFSQELNLNQKLSIPIPKSALLASNTLEFSVSSPGAKFWQTNSYSLLNVNLATSAYAAGKAAKTLSFSLTSEQAVNIVSAKLRASVTRLAGEANLKISVNGKELYSGTRTGAFALDVPIENLKSGTNEISFSVDKDGSYRVSFSKIAINYAKALTVAKKYTFFMNDYNMGQIAQNNLFCIVRIATSESREFITSRINSHDSKIYFVEGVAQENVCQYLIKGDNTIALGSDESVSISSLKVTVAAKQ